MNEDAIFRKLVRTRLNSIQLDPFGYCDNTCWFCPRGYIPNPRVYRRHMPVDLLAHILGQFADGRGTICDDGFSHIWTGHYNEILLYRHFDRFLSMLPGFGMCTTILSNGTNYDGRNIALICDAVDRGVVVGICMNIPAGEAGAYSRYTGRAPGVFDGMVGGVRELLGSLPSWILASGAVSIVVNGVDDDSPVQRALLGPNAPCLPDRDLDRQLGLVSDLFPEANVYRVGGLHDRGGHLTKLGVFDHSGLYAKLDERVVGCYNCGDVGGRPFAWAHVNSIGELFLCCCDYLFEYTFGSLATSSLSDVWYGREHVKMLMKAFDGICRTCCSAEKV